MRMIVLLEGTINGMLPSEYKQTDGYLSFGGYNFQCQVSEHSISVPFDFPGFSANVQDDETIRLEAGADTPLSGNNDFLDDCYDSLYVILGITRDELTAKALASTTKINEFAIDCDENDADLQIQSITFVGDKGDSYEVAQNVIEEFNQRSLKDD